MEPKLIEYFDTSYERYTHEYLVNEKNGKVYLCSILTYQLAQELKKEQQLLTVCTYSLPRDWCSYRYEYKKTFSNKSYPTIIKSNLDIVLDLIKENFYYISRISEFLKEFYDYGCERDFVRCCKVAWAITVSYIPPDLMQNLFNLVFDSFPAHVEKKKFELLMEDGVNQFFSNYN